jgi:predicted dehydrogenase
VSAPFRFGLIGGGRMGRTHLRGLQDSTEVEIVAVTEPVDSAAASLGEQGLSVFATAEQMFAVMSVSCASFVYVVTKPICEPQMSPGQLMSRQVV